MYVRVLSLDLATPQAGSRSNALYLRCLVHSPIHVRVAVALVILAGLLHLTFQFRTKHPNVRIRSSPPFRTAYPTSWPVEQR